MKPIAIDLFCGAGGMSEGVIQAGFHIVYSSDVNESVKNTYTHRHEQHGLVQHVNTFFQQADIRELQGKDILEKIQGLSCFKGQPKREIDAVFGGPPCQGFSRAGLRNKNDPRNMLFKEYIRVVHEVKPRYVVMENVEGMKDTSLEEFIGLDGEKYAEETYVLHILEKEFRKIGYGTLVPQLLDATDYGVPQKRKRLIFIAYRNDQQVPEYPEATTPDDQKVTVLEAIGDLILDPDIRRKVNPVPTPYQEQIKVGQEATFPKNHELSLHSSVITERLSLYQQGETAVQVRKRIQKEGIDLAKYPSLLDMVEEKLKIDQQTIIHKFQSEPLSKEWMDLLLTKKNSRTRLHPEKPSPTMLTNGDDYIHPFENRSLTVREMARLQSFQDGFEFLGKRTTGGLRRRVEVPQYTQVGNAVPPRLSKAIAKEIVKVLNKDA